MSIFLQAPLEILGKEKKQRNKVSLTGQALIWQFVEAPGEISKGWKNFVLFYLNYFSTPTLFKTFFSHWHKYYSPYGKTFELWKNIESFVFNMMSRIIGAVIRTFLIIIGIIVEIFIVLGGTIVLIGWLILPFLLLAGFFFGLWLLS